MTLYQNSLYCNDINRIANMNLPWEKLQNKVILISGGSGLIGSFFVDVIMAKNYIDGLNCDVYLLSRNPDKLYSRFSAWKNDLHLKFLQREIGMEPFQVEIPTIDYILHLASNTHPIQYATKPIETIVTNVVGLKHMLDIAVTCHAKRFVFASSNEIYGENNGIVDKFSENDCGFIDSNTLRAGYPESKRCGEALCQAYLYEKNIDVVISRFTRSYGPTMRMDDTKASSQFIKKALEKEDIILKSTGTQYYSFTYMADAVSGLFYILLTGKCGEAYNIADEASDIRLKDFAEIVSKIAGKKVIFENAGAIESAGFSKATKALLDGGKLRQLGWKPFDDIESGVRKTISILSDLN